MFSPEGNPGRGAKDGSVFLSHTKRPEVMTKTLDWDLQEGRRQWRDETAQV